MVRARFFHSDLPADRCLLDKVRALARPLQKSGAGPEPLDALVDRVGAARCVLLGEATHGTSEFYTWRAEISKKLIERKGFSFVAVEGDWPDCYRVNRFVRGDTEPSLEVEDVLRAFNRWPTWMWANKEVASFTRWLRSRNDSESDRAQVGFYGLDVYSLWDSLYQLMGYVRRQGGEAIEAARRAFHCFQPYGEAAHEYARAIRFIAASCEDEVVELLRSVRAAAARMPNNDRECQFEAEQNALVLKNAEVYYRTMVRGRNESWNVRDRHMAETLDRLLAHHGLNSKAIVWEHNTHIGDARFTDMAEEGTVNVGQLARERYGDTNVVLIGFGTYAGAVIAGSDWEAPMQRMHVPEARANSWEEVLHSAGIGDALLVFDDQAQLDPALLEWRGHRAIGVVYDPRRESYNYVPTVLPRRYDAFVFIDRTRALHPLHMRVAHEGELPETFPTGV